MTNLFLTDDECDKNQSLYIPNIVPKYFSHLLFPQSPMIPGCFLSFFLIFKVLISYDEC